MEEAVKDGANKEAFEERAGIVDEAADELGDLQLAKTGANVLGYANIGGGRESVRLSEERFQAMQTEEDLKTMVQAGGHELGHADAVELKGEIVLDGELLDDHVQHHEGYAEKKGNEKVGMSINEHREGQPDDLYKAGQDDIAEIREIVGDALIERVFTETGELSEIQQVLDKKGHGRKEEETYTLSA